MIELSPKALRFARLVSEMALVGGSRVQDTRHDESFEAPGIPENQARYVSISDDTALFYLKAIDTFLQSQDASPSSDWDGNDLQYLQTIKGHLARSLALDALDDSRLQP